jgi:hypothetical protein
MTILPWPSDPTRDRQPKSPRKMIVDPLPRSVLHAFVADIPGPKGETEAARAARFEAQLAEVLSFNPRDSAEAMLATQCVLLRLVAKDTHRDAARPGLTPAIVKKIQRNAKEFEKLILGMKQTLADRQAQPLGRMDPALCVSLGLGAFLIPDPDQSGPDASDSPDAPDNDEEEAFSAIIVPLHAAPKMLQ